MGAVKWRVFPSPCRQARPCPGVLLWGHLSSTSPVFVGFLLPAFWVTLFPSTAEVPCCSGPTGKCGWSRVACPYWEGNSPETALSGDVSLLPEVERLTHQQQGSPLPRVHMWLMPPLLSQLQNVRCVSGTVLVTSHTPAPCLCNSLWESILRPIV